MSFTASLHDIVAENRNGFLSKHATWLRVELRSVCSIMNGFPFASDLFSKTTGFPLLRIRDILDNDTDTYFNGEFDATYVIKHGDFVIGMDGDFHTGIWKGKNALLNQRVCKLSVDEIVYDKHFLYYTILGYLLAIHAETSSVTVKHLSSLTIGDIPLPLPPLPEQQRIVAKIEELFSKLDAGVVALKKVKRELKRYRQAVLKHAFEGKLTAQWRADHASELEPAEQLLERIRAERKRTLGNKYKPPTPIDFEELAELPIQWVWAQAQDVCDLITNGDTPDGNKMFSNAGDIPYIKVYNLSHNGSLDFTKNPTFIAKSTHDELRRSKIYANDVLMNIVGPPLGKVSIVPNVYHEWNTNQAVVLYRTNELMQSRYLMYCLLCKEIMDWALRRKKATTSQHNLTLTTSRTLPIPLATIEEQQEIVSEIERRFSVADAVEQTIDQALAQATRLRQSILKRAFAGQLVPQDPTDEPASILLDRIKAQRAHATASTATRTRKSIPKSKGKQS